MLRKSAKNVTNVVANTRCNRCDEYEWLKACTHAREDRDQLNKCSRKLVDITNSFVDAPAGSAVAALGREVRLELSEVLWKVANTMISLNVAPPKSTLKVPFREVCQELEELLRKLTGAMTRLGVAPGELGAISPEPVLFNRKKVAECLHGCASVDARKFDKSGYSNNNNDWYKHEYWIH